MHDEENLKTSQVTLKDWIPLFRISNDAFAFRTEDGLTFKLEYFIVLVILITFERMIGLNVIQRE